jgi:hypothetical protein
MIEIKRKRAYQLQSAEKRPSNKSEFFTDSALAFAVQA